MPFGLKPPLPGQRCAGRSTAITSEAILVCLLLGGFFSLFALISWRTDRSHRGARERFLLGTWPIWPVMFVVGLVLWVAD